MKKKRNNPEDKEQEILVAFLTIIGLQFTAIPNSTPTGFHQQNRNKKMGVRKGLSDMLVLIPRDKNKNLALYIEMKAPHLRIKKDPVESNWKEGQESMGGLKKEQREWIKELRKVPGTKACVCYSAEEAIEVVKKYFIK